MERQRPFQKFEGEYLLATSRMAMDESEEKGVTLTVDVGKCSADAVEKALLRDRIVSACCDSRG